jgi:hypothetical protein
MFYNGLVVVFYILSNINMVPKLNHPFLTHSWVTFYIHHKLLKHMQDLICTLEWVNNFFKIFLAFNMCIWIEPFIFNMLKLLLTSCILHILKYIETHAIQCLLIIFNWFCKFYTSLDYQYLYMSRIMHLKPIETITQTLHITFITLYWNTHILMPHIYIWMD